jgi:hypothetical protein
MVEEMLAGRGVSVTYETIRQWGLKFGREFANRIRRRTPRRGDKWHLDEAAITIAGEKHWLWGGNDLLLEACQHPLPVSHGQTQIGNIVEIIRPVDRHDVGKRLVTVPRFAPASQSKPRVHPWSDKRRKNIALALAPPNLPLASAAIQ